MTTFERARLWPFVAIVCIVLTVAVLQWTRPARLSSVVLWHSPKYEHVNGQFSKLQPPIARLWPSGNVTWADGHRPVVPRDYYNIGWRYRVTGSSTTISSFIDLPAIDPSTMLYFHEKNGDIGFLTHSEAMRLVEAAGDTGWLPEELRGLGKAVR